MARTSTVEEQINGMKLDDDSSVSYQAKIATVRQKGVKKEMMISFFETTKKLAEMNDTASTSKVCSSSCSEACSEEEEDGAKDVIEERIVKQTIKSRPPTPGPGAAGRQGVGSSDDADDEGEEASASPKRLNWQKYEITDCNKELLQTLREKKINRMRVDLTSAENIMKMQLCLEKEVNEETTPEMIDKMMSELFTERHKQLAELNGQIDDAVDGVDGAGPAVIHPPPGLGLLDFRSIKSGYVHQFEVWCMNAEPAKFMGMLILNKGRHDRIMKLHYVAHPIMNGIVIIMVETDDQFYFGSKFIEGCGQVQMLNPAVKYMENVIGTGGTQEWRTKCWNAIDSIKHTEYSNPMIDNVTRRSLCEMIPGFGKFGNLLTMEKEAVYGSIVCGEKKMKQSSK